MFQDGDILLCKGSDPVSRLIKWGTKSVYSHVAIIASAQLHTSGAMHERATLDL